MIALAATIAAMSSCSGDGYSGDPVPIGIGSPSLESSALIYIAQEKGFFADNGIEMTVKHYETGAASLKGMLEGESDIAIPAEYGVVGEAFKGTDASVIASVDEVQYFSLIGRKDRGIEEFSDLQGKKIGVVSDTIAEFYLGRFLDISGISTEQITAVEIKYPQSEELIMSGAVDAIVTRPPYAAAIEERLGENATSWPAQSHQPLYAVLVAKNDWISENPEALERLLKSLKSAEDFIISNPDESKVIVQNRLGVDAAYIESVWDQNEFNLSLDQSLILAMEDQARWMMSQGLTPETEMPVFGQHVREDGLRKIKPEAVSIIR